MLRLYFKFDSWTQINQAAMLDTAGEMTPRLHRVRRTYCGWYLRRRSIGYDANSTKAWPAGQKTLLPEYSKVWRGCWSKPCRLDPADICHLIRFANRNSTHSDTRFSAHNRVP